MGDGGEEWKRNFEYEMGCSRVSEYGMKPGVTTSGTRWAATQQERFNCQLSPYSSILLNR